MAVDVDLSSFPGLDLRDEAGMIGAADLRDVRWASDGSLATRNGSELWSAAGLSNLAMAYRFVGSDGSKRIITSSETDRSQVYDGTTGAVLQTNSLGGLNVQGFRSGVRFSTPNEEAMLFAAIDAFGSAADAIYKYTVAGGLVLVPVNTFQHINPLTGVSTNATRPQWSQMAAWSGQERLVGGGYGIAPAAWSGILTDPSMVWVSEPGTPYSYKTSSFIRLGVGDGERVSNIIAWRDLVFVFKRSRFWVLTGTSVAGDGTVRIQKRAIDAGVGCVGNLAACAAPDGVYFIGARGIYRTTGGEPELISDPIAPLFGNAAQLPPFYTGPVIDTTFTNVQGARLAWVYDTLYVTVQQSTSIGSSFYVTFAWHQPTQRWSYWSMPARFIFSHDSRGMDEPHYLPSPSINTGTIDPNHIERCRAGLVGDAPHTNTMFDPFYLGPFKPVRPDSRVTRVRHLKAWGAGTVDLGLAIDFDRSTIRTQRLQLSAGLPGTSREGRAFRQNQYRASHVALYVGYDAINKGDEKAWGLQKVLAGISGGRPVAMADRDG